MYLIILTINVACTLANIIAHHIIDNTVILSMFQFPQPDSTCKFT